MVTLKLDRWEGTPREAVAAIVGLLQELRLPPEPPTERTLRDWRNEGVLTRTGRRFTGRNLLEAIRAKQLRAFDLPITLVREQIQGRSLDDLLHAIQAAQPATTGTPSLNAGERAVVLLAQGVLKQFRAVQEGRPVSLTGVPLALRQSQAYLARLFIEEGRADEVASVHQLLALCRKPLVAWAPRAIATQEQHAQAILIDPDYWVPTEDCQNIAQTAGHLEDLVENQIHQELRRALERLTEDERASAYTLVRRFIAEHPMATHDEVRAVRNSPRITPEVAGFFDKVYEPAHLAAATNGAVRRCARCRAQVRSDGRCVLVSCRQDPRGHSEAPSVPLVDAMIARPEILKYWCDPALEELRLYRELRKSYGDDVHLYPHMDRCDVAIGQEVGIDVKDYRDPIRLARQLNRDLGGLRLYSRRILAVASRRAATSGYVAQLKEHLLAANRQVLEVMSVNETIKALRKERP